MCSEASCRGKCFNIKPLEGSKYQAYLGLRLKCPERNCQQEVTIKSLGNHLQECGQSNDTDWEAKYDELTKQFHDQIDIYEDLDRSHKLLDDVNEKLKVEIQRLKCDNGQLKRDNELLRKSVLQQRGNEQLDLRPQDQRQQDKRQQDRRQRDQRQQNFSPQHRQPEFREQLQSHFLLGQPLRQRQGHFYQQTQVRYPREDTRSNRGQRSTSVQHRQRDHSVASNHGGVNPAYDGPFDLVFDEDETSATPTVRRHLEESLKVGLGKQLAEKLLFDLVNRMMADKLGGRWFSFGVDYFNPRRAVPRSGTACHYRLNGSYHITFSTLLERNK